MSCTGRLAASPVPASQHTNRKSHASVDDAAVSDVLIDRSGNQFSTTCLAASAGEYPSPDRSATRSRGIRHVGVGFGAASFFAFAGFAGVAFAVGASAGGFRVA